MGYIQVFGVLFAVVLLAIRWVTRRRRADKPSMGDWHEIEPDEDLTDYEDIDLVDESQ